MQGRIHSESACGPSSVTTESVHHAFLCREAGCFNVRQWENETIRTAIRCRQDIS
jgi:hypothetical protein